MSEGPRRGAFRPALFFMIAVVLLNGWFAVSAVRALLQSEYWLAHTWQVVSQAEKIMDTAKDGEIGTRGYLLTGDGRYLSAYEGARTEAPREVDEFVRLTSDNAHQRPNAEAMRAVLEQRFAMLQGSVDARRTKGFDAARAMVISGNGLAETIRMHEIGTAMEAEERRLLAMRQENEQRDGVLAYLAVGLATCLAAMLLVLVSRNLVRERQLRIASEATAQELIAANVRIARDAEQMQALNEELEDRVRLRTAELESTNRELEAFSYSVSHDLRAPLRTIDGFSLALEEDYHDVVGEEGRDYIARVRSGVQRMGGLIDALLQLSRITRAEISRTDVDVSALAEAVAGNLREENSTQVLHFRIEPGMRADADPRLLQVAFENLLGNAVKFSSRKPESQISVSFDKVKGAFLVEDNGAGFDMHYASKLFNAFNRLHGDKDFKGSGIGLATVARVVRRHHGRIWADSELGNGASFWFTLG